MKKIKRSKATSAFFLILATLSLLIGSGCADSVTSPEQNEDGSFKEFVINVTMSKRDSANNLTYEEKYTADTFTYFVGGFDEPGRTYSLNLNDTSELIVRLVGDYDRTQGGFTYQAGYDEIRSELTFFPNKSGIGSYRHIDNGSILERNFSGGLDPGDEYLYRVELDGFVKITNGKDTLDCSLNIGKYDM
ncbi:MAG: hypothetical protein HKP14_01125 [Bacteroidia bacterium]|nr:hypothetical protein [Bacteroidia bacterium]